MIGATRIQRPNKPESTGAGCPPLGSRDIRLASYRSLIFTYARFRSPM